MDEFSNNRIDRDMLVYLILYGAIMKDIKELEDMTFFDISVNEGPLTNFVLGFSMILLSIAYCFINIYYWLKFKIISRKLK